MTKLILAVALLACTAHGQAPYQLTIASGQTVSTSLRIGPDTTGLNHATLIAMAMPSAWTAADLLIEASVDGSTWLPVYDSDGARVRIKVDAGRIVVLDASVFWGLPRVRFRSVAVGGTSDTAQGAERALIVIVR